MQTHASCFDDAAARRDAGIQSSAEHAERTAPGWTEQAAKAVHAFAERIFPAGFIMEEARAALTGQLPEPPELRAWGAVTQFCKRRHWIEAIPGDVRCAKSSNSSPKQAYRLGRVA